jgi:hypothetical protein
LADDDSYEDCFIGPIDPLPCRTHEEAADLGKEKGGVASALSEFRLSRSRFSARPTLVDPRRISSQ